MIPYHLDFSGPDPHDTNKKLPYPQIPWPSVQKRVMFKLRENDFKMFVKFEKRTSFEVNTFTKLTNIFKSFYSQNKHKTFIRS